MARRRALITLGVAPDAPAEHYQAQMWALWSGSGVDVDMSEMSRRDRLAALDEISQQFQRSAAPAVIGLWSSDHAAHRGLAADVWHEIRAGGPVGAAA